MKGKGSVDVETVAPKQKSGPQALGCFGLGLLLFTESVEKPVTY